MVQLLAQVLTHGQAEAYAQGRRDVGVEPWRVSGFAVRLEDIHELPPEVVLTLVAAGHPRSDGSPVVYETDPLKVLVFAVGPDARACSGSSAAPALGGILPIDDFAPPVKGHGMLATAEGLVGIEWIVLGSAVLPLGSELRDILADGTQRVTARLGADSSGAPSWRPPDEPAAGVAFALPGEHQLFAEIGGRTVPAVQVGDDAIGVVAPDSRAAWLCYPSASQYASTPVGCLAIYPLAHVDGIVHVETHVTWQGHRLVAEAIDGDTVRVLHLGRPFESMLAAGFAGDQYHGFRAQLPRSAVADFDPQASRYAPGSRPTRTDAAAPFVMGENRRFHREFVTTTDAAPLPVWRAGGPDGADHASVRAPDRRAALLMYPTARELWSDPAAGILVPVEAAFERPVLADAATVVTVADGRTVLVEGADGQSLIGVPTGIAAAPVAIPPTMIVDREDALFAAAAAPGPA